MWAGRLVVLCMSAISRWWQFITVGLLARSVPIPDEKSVGIISDVYSATNSKIFNRQFPAIYSHTEQSDLYDARQSTEFPNELEVQREDGPDDP